MKFWDTSAILPLLVDEPQTKAMVGLMGDDPAAAVVLADFEPRTLPLVTLDDRLAAAARREGFEVLGT